MRARNGFTLISVLIAITLLSVGLMALSKLGARVAATQSDAANRSTAVSIARSYLEQVRARDASTIINEAAQAVNAAGQPTAGGVYTRQLVVNDIRTNVRQVRVLVNFPRGTQPIELKTLIFLGLN
jgi:Tfp pilus assembly protein PilV